MVVIPNMEKPKDCSNCPFYNSEYPWACESLQTIDSYGCPLIEIDESEMEYLYKEFGLEKDENLTERAKELKRAILMGYLYAKRELVHCGECKQYLQDDGKPYCDIWMREVEDNNFCSYGERKGK